MIKDSSRKEKHRQFQKFQNLRRYYTVLQFSDVTDIGRYSVFMSFLEDIEKNIAPKLEKVIFSTL